MAVASVAKIALERGARPDADVVFLSTDTAGQRGELNQFVLSHLGLPLNSIPTAKELTRGYAILHMERHVLAIIVTVGGATVRDSLTANLANALMDLTLAPGATLWIPLMGTGAGRLTARESLAATMEAIDSTGRIATGDVAITISAPETMSGTEFEVLTRFFKDMTGVAEVASSAAAGDAAPLPFLDSTALQYGADLRGLLGIAAALQSYRLQPSDDMSTTLLLFSLSVSDEEMVPPELSASREAKHFALALKELAGSSFQLAWNGYFAENRSIVDGLAPRVPLAAPSLSRNCRLCFERAADVARKEGRLVVQVADVIAALATQEKGRFRHFLRTMGVALNELMEKYKRQLLDDATPGVSAPGVYEYLVHDHASHRDLMNFEQYAVAIASFLTSAETRGPISISIQAPWGTGKSSLMRQVQHKLDGKAGKSAAPGHASILDVLRFMDRKHAAQHENLSEGEEKRWTVWFNVWKYESSEQVWAGLVDAIVSQVSERLDPVQRELFLLRLNLARIDDGLVRKKIYDRLAGYWWVGARWILLLAAPIAVVVHASGAGSPLLVPLLTAGGLAGWLVRAWKKVWAEPATFSLAEYVRVPDYSKSVGVIHQIHADLQRVIKVLPKRRPAGAKEGLTQPLVIFIDDLDRCSPNKVASIVEGINTFLASDQAEFLFVIGMDPQMVAAALEHAHKDVKGYLPSYDQTVPLGWRFMDKFIQLAFTIPPRRSAAMQGFVTALFTPPERDGARQEVPQPATGRTGTRIPWTAQVWPFSRRREASPVQDSAPVQEAPPLDATRVQQAVSKTVTNESEDVRAMMNGIIAECYCSPREVKRILNFVRFVLLLRVGRLARDERVPELAMYQRWVILCMRWPDMVRWLQWGTDALQPTASLQLDGIAAQRLGELEEMALIAPDKDEWCKGATARLGLTEGKVSWLRDAELYRFFANEAARVPAERLSCGASVGFY